MAIYDRTHGGYRIFIGDIGSRVGKHELEKEMEYYGSLVDVWVASKTPHAARYRSSHRNPPGFAFVVYKYSEDADKVVRDLDGRTLCGRRVRVEHARPYESRRRANGPQPRHTQRHRSRSRSRRSRSRSKDRRKSRSRSRSRPTETSKGSRERNGRHRSRSRSTSLTKTSRRHSLGSHSPHHKDTQHVTKPASTSPSKTTTIPPAAAPLPAKPSSPTTAPPAPLIPSAKTNGEQKQNGGD